MMHRPYTRSISIQLKMRRLCQLQRLLPPKNLAWMVSLSITITEQAYLGSGIRCDITFIIW